jgi:hypothetical protein
MCAVAQQDVVVPVEAMKPPFKGVRKKEVERLANQIFFPITGVLPCALHRKPGRAAGHIGGTTADFAICWGACQNFAAVVTSQTGCVHCAMLCFAVSRSFGRTLHGHDIGAARMREVFSL